MDIEVLKRYAKLIAGVGANIQNGQEAVIFAELDQPEFVETLVRECYDRGASKVSVEWEHQPLRKLDIERQETKILGKVEGWEEQRLRRRAEILPAIIYIESEDPDGLGGTDQQKRAEALRMRTAVTKPIRDTMEDKYQWCIAAVPGTKWSRKVFPGLPDHEAAEKLWEAILKASRADGDDPGEAWRKHNADLRARCDYLNSLKLEALEYKASNGTELRVGLIGGARFMGGEEKTLGRGVRYNPNIPSEEIFISPMKGEAEGIVYGTRPLAYRGILIEDFSVRFANGRVSEIKAAKNAEALNELVRMDEGAAMLGECALVPYDSPISRSGLMFYNTLFDENASCHLALGAGFPACIGDYSSRTLAECRKMGINDSVVHQDFMVGTPDLSIDGVTAGGGRAPIFRSGNWAF